MSQINLRDLLRCDFGIDFPISGGLGNSIENPIVIHYRIPNDYVGVEYDILQCLGIGREIEWKFIQQTLFDIDDRKIDQIKIETSAPPERTDVAEIENYYFDITECYGR